MNATSSPKMVDCLSANPPYTYTPYGLRTCTCLDKQKDGRPTDDGLELMLDANNAMRYYQSMIKTFASKETAAAFQGLPVKRIPADIRSRIRAKLQQLNAASILNDLRIPPGNRLEPLKSDRVGQYSIRVNDQWRICFDWQDGDAYDVELVDYH